MINSKPDLLRYLQADKRALNRGGCKPSLFDYVWQFEIALRKIEYYSNCHPRLGLAYMFWKYRYYALATKCNFEIPPNCFDEGLSIAHIGTIVVNGAARIGKNCRIHVDVNIGTSAGASDLAPIIGDDCYIGPGAKIYGPITIGNGVAIGANAVVNKSFNMDNISIAGVPARVISDKGSRGLKIQGQERNHEI